MTLTIDAVLAWAEEDSDRAALVVGRLLLGSAARGQLAPAPSAPSSTPSGDPLTISTAEAAARMGISRWSLDQMVAKAPRNLPGAPTHIGKGTAARHLRWNPDQLATWLESYRDHERSRGKAPSAGRKVGKGAR